MEEPREISDSLIEFWKVSSVIFVLISGFWLLGAVFGVANPFQMSLWSLLLIFISFVLGLVRPWRCKRVVMTPDGLLISHRIFFWEKFIFVPFEEVESIYGHGIFSLNAGGVTIELKQETEFGRKIIFKPGGKNTWPYETLIAELSHIKLRSEAFPKFDRGEEARLFGQNREAA